MDDKNSTKKSAAPMEKRNYWKISSISFIVITVGAFLNAISAIFLESTLKGNPKFAGLTQSLAYYPVFYLAVYFVATILFIKRKPHAIFWGYFSALLLLLQALPVFSIFQFILALYVFYITHKVRTAYSTSQKQNDAGDPSASK